MMIKKVTSKLCIRINSFFSKFNLMAIYTLTIFLIMLITLVCTAITAIILLKAEILDAHFYEQPETQLIFMFILSLVIGIIMTIIGSRIALKLTTKFLVAMRELASGNFNVRIKMTGLIKAKELVEFTHEFNTMAKELGSIEMLRSDFVNNFSHEFKTPIVSLRGFAKLLKEEDLTREERNEYLDIIISESDRLSVLSTNVLNLSKIENQAIITEESLFDLSEQIRRVILMMEPKWVEKKLELEVDLEEVLFYGNAEMLSQVWFNLIDNAIKFSWKEEELLIKLQDSDKTIIFTIIDSGCGMDENTIDHIFDKFYQGDTSHTKEGNGLGMSVVKKIISLHQGQILIESVLEQGTKVIITLPK